MMRATLKFSVFLLCLIVTAGSVHAASFSYGANRKQIKAGVLRVVGAPDQCTFYIMNQRTDLKPPGWEFVNPLAESGVTKDRPEYWTVPWSASFDDFANMDVLLLAMGGSDTLVREQREKLRKFVDNGGMLWIDNQGSPPSTFGDSFFIKDWRFSTGASGTLMAAAGKDAHPLLNRPNLISWEEINRIGPGAPQGYSVTSGAGSGLPNVNYFFSIVVGGGATVISAAQYGSGHVVVTAESVAAGIAAPVGLAPGGACGVNLQLAHSEDLKLAYNIVNWGTEHTTFHKNARHSGYSFSDIGSSFATLWSYPAPAAATPASPAMLDDMVFFVDGNGVLHCLDISSLRDRDGDGSPDDGLRDQSLGAPYDEIWRANVGDASSPTTAYVPVGGVGYPAVFVTTRAGNVLGFDAVTGASLPIPGAVTGEAFTPFTSPILPAPTYADGVLYWGDGNGVLHARDFFSATPRDAWFWPNPISGATMGEALGSPTVGYVRDDITGAVDQMVYLPSTGTVAESGQVRPFPMRAYNEVLTTNAQGNGLVTFQTRSRTNPIRTDAGSWTVYYVTSGGALVEIPTTDVQILQPGKFQIDLGTRASPKLWRGRAIIADYVIDTANNLATKINPRSLFTIKTATGSFAGIASTPALSGKDILYFTTTNNQLYAMQESGRGSTRTIVKWRYYLPDLAAVPYELPSEAVGSPAVAGDMVYVAVKEKDAGRGAILAFRADPAFTLNIGTSIDRTRPVTVKQFDNLDPTRQAMPISGIPDENQDPSRPVYVPFSVDYERGRISFHNFRNGSDTAMDLTASNEITVAFTPATDTGGAGTEVEQVHPVAGDSWNNLAWALPFANEPASSPMVIGNMLYVGCMDGTVWAINVDKARKAAQNVSNRIVPSPYSRDLAFSERVSAGPVYATVAGANGVLALATAEGITILHNPLTLVADSNRVVEVDADGNIIWSCDATSSVIKTTDVFDPNAGPGNTVYGGVTVPFNRPSVARRAPMGGIVVADTGNNRVVQIDRGGNIMWEIKSFNDPAGLLSADAPRTLNRPMDVSAWTQADSNGWPEYRYLIADSGNYRVLEIVARRDASTGYYRNLLAWVTRTHQQGKQYRYTSARRVLMPDPNTGDMALFTMCVISNYQPASGGLEGPGGAIVRIRNDGSALDGLIDNGGVLTELDDGTRHVTLLNPTFYNREFKDVAASEYVDVIVDSGVVYVVRYKGMLPEEIRRYTSEDYLNDKNKPFFPAYAQVLPNDNILIANKATGQTGGMGEIIELTWNGAVYVPAWTASESTGGNSFGLRQPSSAERMTY